MPVLNRPKDLPRAVEETILRRMETGDYVPGKPAAF